MCGLPLNQYKIGSQKFKTREEYIEELVIRKIGSMGDAMPGEDTCRLKDFKTAEERAAVKRLLKKGFIGYDKQGYFPV